MSKLNLADTRVGKIVAKNPSVARVFEDHQIDYCCRGATTLTEACAAQNVDVQQIIDSVQGLLDSSEAVEETNWNELPLTELADHIVETHHAFLKNELPRISSLVERVFNAHGQKRPDLGKVLKIFNLLREELELHLSKEEQVLFPAIRAIDSQGGPKEFSFGSVANPIGMMEHEHEDAGYAVRRLRSLTDNFTPPRDACPTYCVMMESLKNLEQDLHLHIHKENNILFPRAKELEGSLGAV